MAKKDLRTCCVCRRTYQFCPVCNSEDVNKPSWYFAYCSENCKDIYEITSAFEDGRMTDVEAKDKLSKLDLSRKDNFGESYQRSITFIMKAKTQLKKTLNKKENKVDKEPTKKDIVIEVEEKTDDNVE